MRWFLAVLEHLPTIKLSPERGLLMPHLDPAALFTLGDFKAEISKLLQTAPVIYVCEQSPEGVYVVQLDKTKNLVVDDKQGLAVSLGDLTAKVKPTRDGGCMELRFRAVELDVYGSGDRAQVSSEHGQGVVFKEGAKVVLIFGTDAPIETGVTTILKSAIANVAKWRAGVLRFKAA